MSQHVLRPLKSQTEYRKSAPISANEPIEANLRDSTAKFIAESKRMMGLDPNKVYLLNNQGQESEPLKESSTPKAPQLKSQPSSEPRTLGKRFCESCGNPVSAGGKFCSNCGTKQ